MGEGEQGRLEAAAAKINAARLKAQEIAQQQADEKARALAREKQLQDRGRQIGIILQSVVSEKTVAIGKLGGDRFHCNPLLAAPRIICGWNVGVILAADVPRGAIQKPTAWVCLLKSGELEVKFVGCPGGVRIIDQALDVSAQLGDVLVTLYEQVAGASE